MKRSMKRSLNKIAGLGQLIDESADFLFHDAQPFPPRRCPVFGSSLPQTLIPDKA